uniref:Protein NRT1/ PTR FAMILY 5.2-like n=1 Tax=Ananas comosus var. bracteatus TaxID=296719 RepID=A0A6V7QLY0_ANACO|nr:unnamed protein product [Ananas comosus var. bracteatus]
MAESAAATAAAAVDAESRRGEYTKDGSVDLKGNPVLRSTRGGWTACSFVVVYEVFERMAYYGISSNLVLYLTTKLHQGTVSSANNVTNWVGTIWMTPIIGAYVADAHLGRYRTFIIASVIYLLALLENFRNDTNNTLSLPPLTQTPPCNPHTTTAAAAGPTACSTKASSLQLGVFFAALYILAVGTGGTKPNISTIGADQFDEFDPREKAHKLSFFNWWMFSIFIGTLFANTVLVYIQDNVGWSLGYALPTAGLAVSVAIFVAGTPFYRHKLPAGSPFTRMARVLVAAARKWRVPLPTHPDDLHDPDLQDYANKNRKFRRIRPTPALRALNKAAVKTGPATPWMLCTVTQVEETKLILKMIPILFRDIPPATLQAFVTISMLVSVVIYDRYFVTFMRRWTKDPRGISLLQRMGVGLVLHIFIMAIASVTERRRLSAAREHNVVESGGKVPLTIFILLPQFVLMGVADSFLEVAKIEFFYDQAPEGMKSLGTSYAMTSLGVGNFLSSLLLSTVSRMTERNGHKGWILNNLNESHLDYYYAVFTALNCANLIFFFFVSRFYVYKAEISEFADESRSEEKQVPVPTLTNRNGQVLHS